MRRAEDASVPRSPAPPPRARLAPPAWLARAIAAAVLGAAMVLVFAYATGHRLDRDESFYVTAGVMVRGGALYADVPYLQMPYLPWIYAAVLPAPGEGPLLLVGRIFSVVCACAVLAAIVAIAVRTRQLPFVGLVFAWLLAVHPVFLATSSVATNHVAPLAAFAGAAWLVLGRGGAGASRRALIAGVLMGVAAGLRLTWSVVALALGVAIALAHPNAGWWRRPTRPAAAYALGVGFGLVPAAVASARNAETFIFQSLTYHTINRRWAIASEQPWSLERDAIVADFAGRLTEPATAGLLLALLVVAMTAVGHRTLSTRHVAAGAIVWLGALVASALPSPFWPQHALPVVATSAGLGALACRGLAHPGRLPSVLLLAAALVAVVPNARRHGATLRDALAIDGWLPVRLHAAAQPLGDANVEGAIATLAPLHALEAGLSVDPRSTSGTFLHRIRSLLTPEERALTAGGEAILDLDRAPDAVLVGYEPPFEEGLDVRLRGRGYTPAAYGWREGVLWVAPRAGAGGER